MAHRTNAPVPANVLHRVQGEFLEMPGLRLTDAQARRLWDLDAATCAALLDELIASRFLFRTCDGAVMRIEYARPVKKDPRSGGEQQREAAPKQKPMTPILSVQPPFPGNHVRRAF